jgi:hypothetical protein
MKFSLYAIYAVARNWQTGGADDEDFDTSSLPIEIADGAKIEDVSALVREDTFAFVKADMGTSAVENLQGVHYAIIHRYESQPIIDEFGQRQSSETLVRNLAACLRLIRPMRQFAQGMHGNVRGDGTLDVMGFDHPIDLLETPENQKLFTLRNRDAAELRYYAPEFLKMMQGSFWKSKMATQFHELGHFQHWDWKARYLLWASAIESIYTSHHREHKGSLVAKERIKWFLGENTSIYPSGELSSLLQDPTIRVGQVVEELYNVRNFIAHGDRIPDRYFKETLRDGINGRVNLISVLFEAASFIIRYSLLKILRDGLLPQFAEAAHAEAYFATQHLTHSELARRPRP